MVHNHINNKKSTSATIRGAKADLIILFLFVSGNNS